MGETKQSGSDIHWLDHQHKCRVPDHLARLVERRIIGRGRVLGRIIGRGIRTVERALGYLEVGSGVWSQEVQRADEIRRWLVEKTEDDHGEKKKILMIYNNCSILFILHQKILN